MWQNLQTCSGSHTHTHVHTYAREKSFFIPNDFSTKPVLSPAGFRQLPFVNHAFQQRVERAGRYPAPFAHLKGLAAGETERQQIKKCVLR